MSNLILDSMEDVRTYDHLFLKLRKQLGIPLRQPLLDYGFGADIQTLEKGKGFLLKDFWKELVNGLNIFDQGNDKTSFDFYHGQETVKPVGEHWSVLEENGYWVALNTNIPDWLREVGEKRKTERQQIMNNKLNNLK